MNLKESYLFLEGPSSKSEELISLEVEDTCDASSFSFSSCSDPGLNPLDGPLPRSPVIKKAKELRQIATNLLQKYTKDSQKHIHTQRDKE